MFRAPIEHRHYKSARQHLKFALREHVPGGLVGICGMPGAGKTFLRNEVLREILGAPDEWGEGYIPATEVMVLLDTNCTFSPKAFAARCHRAALKPDLRALYRNSDEQLSESYLESLLAAEKAWFSSRFAQGTPEHEYWRAFGETLIDRKIKYVLFEHGAAIGKSAKGEEPKNHLWNLMSLLETTETMGILNLIPEGYQLWEGRPEIAERLERVFIRPYDVLDKAQPNEVANEVVMKVGSNYALESEEVIRCQIIEIAIATATSMRPVKKMFAKAQVNAASRGSEKISAADLAAAFETPDHGSALWDQAKLLHRISRPATKDELFAIHRAHLAAGE